MNKHRQPTILIVDDMPINITILYDLLRHEYHLKAANNGKDALTIARSVDKPDLILLDIEMLGVDGYAVCKALKSDVETQRIPVIFVTSRQQAVDEAYGLSLGAVDYITKPFHPAIVKVRIKNHLELKLKRDQLEALSMEDSLLQIPNRRYFDSVYLKCYRAAKREHRHLAVMMMDVDFFKAYNDHYGHAKGDEVLIRVAAALAQTLKRPTDMVARYGGEEFVVLVKDTDQAGVQHVVEALVAAVSALAITHAYSPVADHVTISVGCAWLDDDVASKEALLQLADEALYRAKRER